MWKEGRMIERAKGSGVVLEKLFLHVSWEFSRVRRGRCALRILVWVVVVTALCSSSGTW